MSTSNKKNRRKLKLPGREEMENHGMNRAQMLTFRFAIAELITGISLSIYVWDVQSVVGIILAGFLITHAAKTVYGTYLETQ